MPIYDYQCTACQHRTEVIHGRNEAGPAACQLCGGPMRKLFAPPSIVFKGTGWAKKERGSSGATRSSAAKADGSSGGSGSGDGSAGGSGSGDGGSGGSGSGGSADGTATPSTSAAPAASD